MAFRNTSALCYLAVSVFWEQFSLLIIAAAGVAFLLSKRLKKRAAEDPPVKVYRPRFNQRSGTAFAELRPNPVLRYASCHCFDPQYEAAEREHSGETNVRPEWHELLFHPEVQHTDSEAWKCLEAYIAKVREAGSDELNPRAGIGSELWEQIVTLPKSIGTLKSVKFLSLYGSHLVRIPPEIGDMTNLEEFDPYTSRCLHWFPYEITKCKRLTRSRVSTRCLYGNYKYRSPFPRLPQISPTLTPATCSVCGGPFSREQILQAWISLRVATDVLPLLVHACSEKCIEILPKPAVGYVQRPHFGGFELEQPPAGFRQPPLFPSQEL
jgi:ADP-ribose pyrophosphatase YjhB (NUDIX family)